MKSISPSTLTLTACFLSLTRPSTHAAPVQDDFELDDSLFGLVAEMTPFATPIFEHTKPVHVVGENANETAGGPTQTAHVSDFVTPTVVLPSVTMPTVSIPVPTGLPTGSYTYTGAYGDCRKDYKCGSHSVCQEEPMYKIWKCNCEKGYTLGTDYYNCVAKVQGKKVKIQKKGTTTCLSESMLLVACSSAPYFEQKDGKFVYMFPMTNLESCMAPVTPGSTAVTFLPCTMVKAEQGTWTVDGDALKVENKCLELQNSFITVPTLGACTAKDNQKWTIIS